MKGRTIFLIILLVVIADQALKIFVKTHYHVGESHPIAGNWAKLYFIENEGHGLRLEVWGGMGENAAYSIQLAL